MEARYFVYGGKAGLGIRSVNVSSVDRKIKPSETCRRKMQVMVCLMLGKVNGSVLMLSFHI